MMDARPCLKTVHGVNGKSVRRHVATKDGFLGADKNTMSFAFVAEATLGKLAKWLRIIGFDTIYAPKKLAEALMGTNGKPRIFLTRTRRMMHVGKTQTCIFIVSNDPFEQLKEVIDAVDMMPEDLKPFSRCIRCNISIRQIDKTYIRGLVPDHILETQHIFQTCTGCGRIYWPGTHTERSREVIKKLFE